jgi:hypothetical protein
LFTIRGDEVPLRTETEVLLSEAEREGKLLTREGEAAPPDAGLTFPRSTVRRSGETAGEPSLRAGERVAAFPEDERMMRPDSERPAESPTVRRDGDATATPSWPDEEFDLRSCEDNRFPPEEKFLPTDRRPSRERVCRAREAMSPSALSAGRRLGWELRREMFPSCPTRPRSRATCDSLRFWSWSRWTTVKAIDPLG